MKYKFDSGINCGNSQFVASDDVPLNSKLKLLNIYFSEVLFQFHLMGNILGSTSDGPLLVGYIFLYVVPKYHYRRIPS